MAVLNTSFFHSHPFQWNQLLYLVTISICITHPTFKIQIQQFLSLKMCANVDAFSHFQMLSLLKLKETKGKLDPYNTPIKCVIAATLPATTYTKNGGEKAVQELVLCDNTSHMKAVCFETSKLQNLHNQPTVMIKNYVYNNEKIIITSSTQLFKTKPMEVDDTTINAAVQYLRPTTPPPAAVAEIKQSPIKTLQSVAGTVVQVIYHSKVLFPCLLSRHIYNHAHML